MIFTNFESTDIVSGRVNQVSSGYFGNGELTFNQKNFTYNPNTSDYLNPIDVKSNSYYTNVYNKLVSDNGDFLFSVAYGDYDNTGSSVFSDPNILTNTDVPESFRIPVLNNETKTIYSQYKNMLLQPGDELFTFASASGFVDGKSIFVISFAADKMKDRIDPGQLQINFAYTSSNNETLKTLSLIDDSKFVDSKQSVYNLVRGKIIDGVPVAEADASDISAGYSYKYEGLGLFYPANGVIILNAEKLNDICNIITYDSESNAANFREYYTTAQYDCKNLPPENSCFYRDWSEKLIDNMIVSGGITGENNTPSQRMYVRKSEFVPSTTYFIRVKNQEYNYSNNPTFVSDGTDGQIRGTIKYQELIDNPRTYVTTVGLYNDNNELLAVGKLSYPCMKSFDTELLLKCKIDF